MKVIWIIFTISLTLFTFAAAKDPRCGRMTVIPLIGCYDKIKLWNLRDGKCAPLYLCRIFSSDNEFRTEEECKRECELN
ncbi:uncharacterized protein Dwil_GK27640 [Drosophila willistoni]|uniref:BPTI/Kunitz inhibitor domain-containing protein n=1 Tax=Drosophila willistoni TaxID=7260 RepID=A0A0Q9X117_DROWI|nr:uncharacterized protein Dwil_GK27640 [Drosophila willistoni]